MLFLNTNKKYTVNQSEIEKKYYLRNSRKITSFEQPTGRFFTLEKDNRYIECPYITTKSSRHERMILRLKNINAKKRLSVYRGGDRTVLINANYVFPAHAGVILSRCFCNGFFYFYFFMGDSMQIPEFSNKWKMHFLTRVLEYQKKDTNHAIIIFRRGTSDYFQQLGGDWS